MEDTVIGECEECGRYVENNARFCEECEAYEERVDRELELKKEDGEGYGY